MNIDEIVAKHVPCEGHPMAPAHCGCVHVNERVSDVHDDLVGVLIELQAVRRLADDQHEVVAAYIALTGGPR